MAYFSGDDLGRFDRIYDIADLPALRDVLAERAVGLGAVPPTRALPPIPRSQAEGPEIGLGALDAQSFTAILETYAVDYDLFPGLDRGHITAEWQLARAREPRPAPPEEITLSAVAQPAVVNARLLREPQVLTEKNGQLGTFTGYAVVRKNQPEQGRLLFRDADGLGLLPWSPSPRLAERFPGNPYAAEARFVAKRLRAACDRPVSIMWEDPASGDLLPVFRSAPTDDRG